MINKLISILIFIGTCQQAAIAQKSDSLKQQDLYKTIEKLDSVFFDTYNTCKLDAYMAFFADSFEFYHDKGGLMTSHAEMRESIRKNVCNRVRRELKKGSIEVSPVPGFGAVEIGMHRFHNQVEHSTSNYARFVIIWKEEKDGWKISKVISLH